jgi:hypothetical protein
MSDTWGGEKKYYVKVQEQYTLTPDDVQLSQFQSMIESWS